MDSSVKRTRYAQKVKMFAAVYNQATALGKRCIYEVNVMYRDHPRIVTQFWLGHALLPDEYGDTRVDVRIHLLSPKEIEHYLLQYKNYGFQEDQK